MLETNTILLGEKCMDDMDDNYIIMTRLLINISCDVVWLGWEPILPSHPRSKNLNYSTNPN